MAVDTSIAESQVLTEIANGEGIRLSQAARLFPPCRRGRAHTKHAGQFRPVSLSCVLRWITDGVRGPGGRRIKLEAARLPSGWVTTKAAVCRFVGAQTPNIDGTAVVPKTARTPTARQRAAARADRELSRVGI